MLSRQSPAFLPTITSRAADVAPRPNARRVRPELRLLETRDATGNMVGGVVAAALGDGIINPLDRLAALTGDWALTPDGPTIGDAAFPSESQAATKAGKPLAAWLPPQLELDSLDLTPRPTRAAQSNAAVPQTDTDRIEARRLGRFEDIGIAPVASAIHITVPSQPPPASAPPSLQAPIPTNGATDASHAPIGWGGVTIVPAGATPAAPIGVRINFEYVPNDPPPNQAPTATDDTISTDEDTPVEINVLANDSDPDGDTLTIDDWDDPADGSVTLESDGTLKYTPDPDYENTSTGYSPPDTFTYTVTDGLATATATVTITVNAVNDAPVAFNDGAVFANAYTEPPYPDDPDRPVALYSTGGDNMLFDNDLDYDGYDSDYDGVILHIAATDMTGTVGQVTVYPDGSTQWSVPWDFTGETEFRYKVSDDQGGESDWATVKLWAVPSPYDPPPPQVVANPDTFFVGDDPISGNVLANDSGGATYAVLQSHPGGGRITSFGFDGTVQYEPGFEHGDTSFTYVVFNANGGSSGSGSASLNAVNMDIYDGQNGTTRLSEPKENKFGAITVANRNDTDSDYTKDDVDPIVQAGGQAFGEDEKDLMQLVVHQPKGMQGNVTISSNSPDVYFYNNSLGDVNGLYGATAGLSADKFNQGTAGSKYAVVWVESRQWSTNVADITITMTYGGATENAKVTAIWAEMTAFRATGQQGTLVDAQSADGKAYRANFDHLMGGTGGTGKLGTDIVPFVRPGSTDISLDNGVEMEFTLHPTGIGLQKNRVVFDVSRSVESRSGLTKNDGTYVPSTSVDLQPDRDNSNDDLASYDEIDKPIGDKLYSHDGPGWDLSPATQAAYKQAEIKLNGFEFVRVRIGANRVFVHPAEAFPGKSFPPGTTSGVQGSRASELYDWHSWSLFQRDANGTWTRPTVGGKVDTTFNEVDRGRKAI